MLMMSIGFALLLAATLLFTTTGTYIRRHDGERWIDKWMVAEMVAVTVVGMGVTGASCLIRVSLEGMWTNNPLLPAVCVLGAMLILALGILTWRWSVRRLDRAAVPAMPASLGPRPTA